MGLCPDPIGQNDLSGNTGFGLHNLSAPTIVAELNWWGSNLAASNPALRERIAATAKDIAAREGMGSDQIPTDLLASSGSGLDPDISLAAAELQVARITKVRGVSEATLREAIRSQTEQPFLGVFGQARVNVLKLNAVLEK